MFEKHNDKAGEKWIFMSMKKVLVKLHSIKIIQRFLENIILKVIHEFN